MTKEEMADWYIQNDAVFVNNKATIKSVKLSYLAGLEAGRELAYKEMNTEKMLKVLKDRDVIKSWYYNGAYHAEVD